MLGILKKSNQVVSEWYVNKFKYEPYIQTILLHKVYNSRSEVKSINGTIAEGVDKTQLESFVKYYKERNVSFINENDLLEGRLEEGKQYIYLTFDDGYYNNYNCLDVLNKYDVKATFYITTDHVKYGKAYWWDSLSRELTIRDKYSQMDEMVKELYQMRWPEQEKYLVDKFGPGALKPSNDLDRPMTKRELEVFAKNKNVTLGNHTHYHINLKLYTDSEIIESIRTAETFLSEITDKKIRSISYPHGFVDEKISKLLKSLGYEIGITTVQKKNQISDIRDIDKRLLLNRVQLSGYFDMDLQCRNLHTNNFSVSAKLKSLIK